MKPTRREFILKATETALFLGIASNFGLLGCKKEDSPSVSNGTATTPPPVIYEEVTIHHIRHATSIIKIKGVTILIDPLLTSNVNGTNLPMTNADIDNLLNEVDIILLSHAHNDHIDSAKIAKLKNKPIFCQPADAQILASMGFTNVKPISTNLPWKEITINRTPALHGKNTGFASSGYVLQATGVKTIYITGDTIWYEEVEKTLTKYLPGITIVNAGAEFSLTDPMTMTKEHVENVCTKAPNTQVVAVHMGFPTVSFWKETKADLKTYLDSKNLSAVLIPNEGDVLKLS